MEDLIRLAKQDDALREHLQRECLVELRALEAMQIQFSAAAKHGMLIADTLLPEHCTESTIACLKGAAHLMALAATSMDTPVQMFRDKLDQLGTPE